MRMDKICEKIDGHMKVCIWGVGAYGLLGYGILQTAGVQVDFFCDNNEAEWGKEVIDGIQCIDLPSLVEVKEQVTCFIMLKRRYLCDDIYQQLSGLGFQNLICRYEIFDPGRTSDIIQQIIKQTITTFYYKNPRKNNFLLEENCGKKKGIIYTCVTGNYDNIDDIQIINPAYDYCYIADNEISNIHNMKYINIDTVVPHEITNPIMKARYCKTHPHILFPEYNVSIYFDGKLTIVGDITGMVPMVYGNKVPMGVFRHPDRDCVYKEGIACTLLRKASKREIISQLNKYLEKGMPYQFGLIDTCFLVRMHNDPICIRIMDEWWKEMVENTSRDQLSFTYVLWNNNYILKDLCIMPYDLVKNQFFKIKKHER